MGSDNRPISWLGQIAVTRTPSDLEREHLISKIIKSARLQDRFDQASGSALDRAFERQSTAGKAAMILVAIVGTVALWIAAMAAIAVLGALVWMLWPAVERCPLPAPTRYPYALRETFRLPHENANALNTPLVNA